MCPNGHWNVLLLCKGKSMPYEIDLDVGRLLVNDWFRVDSERSSNDWFWPIHAAECASIHRAIRAANALRTSARPRSSEL